MFIRSIFVLTILAASLVGRGTSAGLSTTFTTDPYPGSGHDFDMNLQIDGSPVTIPGVVEASIYDELELGIVSPEGTFDGAEFIIYAQPFTTGGLPFPNLPTDHYVQISNAQVMNDTSNPSDFGTPTIKPADSIVVVEIPPSLAGAKFMIQAFAYDPNDPNVLATSRGYELHILQ